ncbi:hypothetical protein M0804_001577 [Polistes exclamans]|nr:hypothetical protein M0804_001577 [Polistes exclamans]
MFATSAYTTTTAASLSPITAARCSQERTGRPVRSILVESTERAAGWLIPQKQKELYDCCQSHKSKNDTVQFYFKDIKRPCKSRIEEDCQGIPDFEVSKKELSAGKGKAKGGHVKEEKVRIGDRKRGRELGFPLEPILLVLLLLLLLLMLTEQAEPGRRP